jgi:alpha-tubulin suppressor-like RCC1 family protein
LNPHESTPMTISGDSFPQDIKFVQVAAGDSCSFALTERGLVYGWGSFRVSAHPQGTQTTFLLTLIPRIPTETKDFATVRTAKS